MLQQVVIKRIERLYRLRLVYGVHLAIFGIVMVLCALNATEPSRMQSAALLLLTWLPVLLLHTAVQTVNEVRERCALDAPVAAPAFSQVMVSVDIYDEAGNLVRGDENGMNLLPRPRMDEF